MTSNNKFLHCSLSCIMHMLLRSVQLLSVSEKSSDTSFALTREYWMIYSGPGFLAVVPPPPHPPPVSKVDRATTQEDWEREKTRWQERGEGGGLGADSYGREKTWSSLNQSIISGSNYLSLLPLSIYLSFFRCRCKLPVHVFPACALYCEQLTVWRNKLRREIESPVPDFKKSNRVSCYIES